MKGEIAKGGTPMDYGQDALPGGIEWLIQFGARALKGERKDVRVLPNGRVQVMLEYPSLPDVLAIFEDFDALRAMARLHQPRSDRLRPLAEPLSKRLPKRRLDV